VGRATSKTTPVDGDKIPIRDSVTPFGLRGLTWSNLKATLKTYFDGIYSALGHSHASEFPETTATDDVLMGDESHAWVKKTIAELKTALGLGTAAYVAENLYALLGGRSGGQTLKGGAGAGESLTLQSTNHATKGPINIGTSVYDEVNNRLGIGITPARRFDVKLGTNVESANQPGGTWAAQIYHATNNIGMNGLLTKINCAANTSTILEAGYDLIGGDYACCFKVDGQGQAWIKDNCSALSFTDRTEAFIGDALKEIEEIAATKDGKIDHATLPAFAQAKRMKAGKEVAERNIGNMVSILTKAVQELNAKNKELEAKIAELSKSK
jgi:hypothetical protein